MIIYHHDFSSRSHNDILFFLTRQGGKDTYFTNNINLQNIQLFIISEGYCQNFYSRYAFIYVGETTELYDMALRLVSVGIQQPSKR